MAHMIDETTGRAAIAYRGETPWHGLGQELTAGATIAQWTEQAGLSHSVERAPVMYGATSIKQVGSIQGKVTERKIFDERHVLYRSDTLAPLSVVSKDYQVVQPAEVMQFFAELVDIGGFEMETAGALSDGKRIWALAKVNDGAPIIGNDIVKPYVLLSTSYDGSLATTGKLTAIRVVCHNTITAALQDGRAEIKIPHSTKFDSGKMRRDLGIFSNNFEKWFLETQRMSTHELSLNDAAELTKALVLPGMRANKEGEIVPEDNRSFKRIMELFDGDSIGFDMAGFTSWGWLNAVTQYVDHERGRSNDTRMNAAWFGTGDALKSRAFDLAAAL